MLGCGELLQIRGVKFFPGIESTMSPEVDHCRQYDGHPFWLKPHGTGIHIQARDRPG